MNESQVERAIKTKGLTAPRLTPTDITNTIQDVAYYVFPGTTLTVCALTLRNGFTVTGESASASLENFDPVVGKTIAFDNARDKIWALEGYLLKQTIFEGLQNDKTL